MQQVDQRGFHQKKRNHHFPRAATQGKPGRGITHSARSDDQNSEHVARQRLLPHRGHVLGDAEDAEEQEYSGQENHERLAGNGPEETRARTHRCARYYSKRSNSTVCMQWHDPAASRDRIG